MAQAINVVAIMPTFMQQQGLKVLTAETGSGAGYQILGETMQILTISLAPGQQIQTEPGTMCYGSDGCKLKVKIGGLIRLVSGESIFKALWTNSTNEPGFVALTPNLPGAVIPINLDALGGSIRCKRDAFLAALDPNVRITVSLLNTDSCLACCCSGMDMVMQDVRGQGTVFLQAHGTIMQKELAAGEEVVVDTNAVVAVGAGVTVDVVMTGGCCTMLCASEGIFNTTLKGPGLIILCSMPLEKLRRLFPRPRQNGAAGAAADAAGSAM